MGREEEYEIGLWTWSRFFRFYFLDRNGVPKEPAPTLGARVRRHVRWIARLPFDLLWCLPRDIWRARRSGCTEQIDEIIRGLWDGLLDRPLPLKRLGLQ